MVTINLTLFFQLGLFLIFLWGTRKFIFDPILKVLDSRDEKLEHDQASTQTDNAEAQGLEERYAKEFGAAKRLMNDQVREAYREDQRKHMAGLTARQQKAEKEIDQARATAMDKVGHERATFDQLLPSISEAIATCLGLGGHR